MRYSRHDVDAGLRAGIERFTTAYSEESTDNFLMYLKDDEISLLREALHTWPENCTGRFVSLSAEIFALAAAVRTRQNENALTQDDLRCMLGFLSWLLNSFKHP